mgnify:CR=1 FL=1
MFIMPEFLFPLYSIFTMRCKVILFFSERGNFLLKSLLM